MKDFDRAIESLGDTVGELFVDDGLEAFHYIEDLKLAIECLKIVKGLKDLIA